MAYIQTSGDIRGLYVRDSCSGAIRQIGRGQILFGDYSLSPDGSMIVFDVVPASVATTELFVASTETGLTAQISVPVSGYKPQFSPDGQTIAFLADSGGPLANIDTVQPDGSNLKQVLPASAYSDNSAQYQVGDVTWTPDSSALNFTTGESLYTVNADGSGFATLWANDTYSITGSHFISPNGKTLYYDGTHGSVDGQDSQTWSCSLPCGTPRKITLANESNLQHSTETAAGLVYYQAGANSGQTNPSVSIRSLNLATGVDAPVETVTASGDNINDIEVLPVAKPTTCPTLKLFGVRGSGETQSQDNGFGDTIGPIEAAISQAIPGVEVKATNYRAINFPEWKSITQDISYPANYAASVNTGTGPLLSDIQSFEAICPSADIMLAGYSQGADVIDAVLWKLTAAQRKHVVATVFFGDPGFVPGKPFDQGDYDRTLGGLAGSWELGIQRLSPTIATEAVDQRIPSDLSSRVQDYCAEYDPACNQSGTNDLQCIENPTSQQAGCAHYDYVRLGWTNKGTVWAIQQWAASPNIG